MPRFSVVIPTRNRPEYLHSSICSILSSTFSDFEVIVSDNSDADKSLLVQEVLSEICDSRLRYVRPVAAPIAMSAHWEFALRNASGDYLTLLGDDDALMPSSLAILSEAFCAGSPDVLQWPYVFYSWPDAVRAQKPHGLLIRNFRQSCHAMFSVVTEKELLSDLRIWGTPHDVMPTFYNSAVSRAVAEKVFSGEAPVLRSRAPDVYSGLIIARAAKTFGRVSIPLSVAGQSGASNGASVLQGKPGGKNEVAKDYLRLNAAQGIIRHRRVPRVEVMAAEIACNLETFYDVYGGDRFSLEIDSREFIEILVSQVMALNCSEEDERLLLFDLRNHYSHVDYANDVIDQRSARASVRLSDKCITPWGCHEQYCHIDCSICGVDDVATAARLAEAILALSVRKLTLQTPAAASSDSLEWLKETCRYACPPIVWDALRRIIQKGGDRSKTV
jgi:hypothetical protein